MNANEMFEQAFKTPREARSDEYKAGVYAALQYKTGEVYGLTFPYTMGTSAADAWFSGLEEGKRIFEKNTC